MTRLRVACGARLRAAARIAPAGPYQDPRTFQLVAGQRELQIPLLPRRVHIVDRQKDVILSGGENVSSPEVEDALYKHAAVLECAVIGIPHEKWGETPLALVVLRAGKTATGESLIVASC